ncbi:MAG: transcription termination factor Rho [Clostridia bacterium]|nr:transcription termination factor Rho [Clostridia bacterium]
MTYNELNQMTVLQLRKLAKENSVVLGSGIDKAGIIDKLLPVLSDNTEPEPPVHEESTLAEPKYQAAWHNSDTPKYSARPAYQAPGSAPRPAWQSTSPSGQHMSLEQQHAQPLRPGGFTPRFGPAASSAPVQHSAPAEESAEKAVPPVASPLPEKRIARAPEAGFGPRTFGPGSVPVQRPQENVPFSPLQSQDTGIQAPTLEELLAAGDYEEGGGILELHPDGYGFLRNTSFQPSTKDIYVSMAQIRRFGLRTGDFIKGKIRPQREGDKYAALLYISSVNDIPEEEAFSRPAFDELTPVYPSRRISLESKDGKSFPDMRLLDLIAPLGFGQRGLMLCPPQTGKTEIMQHFASVVCKNYPDVHVLMLMIDVNPEDVTLVRDSVPCTVLASTFDQPPEAHLRLSEIVLERAMRLVEQKKDVVLIVDSLTRLAKIYTTAAAQQGRSLPGMVNPSSLFRAKRLFGAARACKEGGSLTVLAAMDIATGSKVDDSVVEEFKGTANMELTLDQNVARAGVSPALNLQLSYTKNSDILLDTREKEGLSLIRTMLGNTSSSVAIPQLVSMMEKTDSNAALLLKMKDWFALMNR